MLVLFRRSSSRGFCMLAMALTLGCEQPVAISPSKPASSGAEQPAAPPDVTTGPVDPGGIPPHAQVVRHEETWHANNMQGKKIGYRHTQIREYERGSRKYVLTNILEKQSVRRFGEKLTLEIRLSQLANDQGEILQFTYDIPLGENKGPVQAVIHDGRATFIKGTHEQQPADVEFPAGTQGFDALEASLAAKPMQPGEERTLRMLQVPPLALVSQVKLVARNLEPVLLPAGEVQLLRIEELLPLPGGGEIVCSVWADDAGQIVKYAIPQLQQETYLVTKEQALEESDAFGLDLGTDLLVRLPQPLADPHSKKEQTYRVHWKTATQDRTVENLFSSGLTQEVKRIDDQTAVITVKAIGPTDPAIFVTPSAPKAVYRERSSLIQSDSPEIRELAKQAIGNGADDWQKATAIEKFVHEYLTEKNYSQAFSSAAEVARTKEGDCTEHAVLLAALGRAKGIPTRVAYGLVYVKQQQAFAFHMWNEAWIDDRWVPLDGTLARQGIGAGHIKFGDSALQDLSALLELFPLMQAVGQLEISAEEK